MELNIISKYNYNDIVKTKDNKEGRVISITIWQTKHFRKDAYIITYELEPIDCINTEHDEQFYVSESEIINKIND
jgi:hypothetical protein